MKSLAKVTLAAYFLMAGNVYACCLKLPEGNKASRAQTVSCHKTVTGDTAVRTAETNSAPACCQKAEVKRFYIPKASASQKISLVDFSSGNLNFTLESIRVQMRQILSPPHLFEDIPKYITLSNLRI